jgi:hypothetical protein
MEEIEGNVVEADVLNQITEVKKEKSCKTCGGGGKGIGRNNVSILVFGFAVLFTSFYGIVRIVQDIYHSFAR